MQNSKTYLNFIIFIKKVKLFNMIGLSLFINLYLYFLIKIIFIFLFIFIIIINNFIIKILYKTLIKLIIIKYYNVNILLLFIENSHIKYLL